MRSDDFVQIDPPAENAALMNEVRVMEDRIEITLMEIEDLEDYCRKTAGEIDSLRSRLDSRSDIAKAGDQRTEISAAWQADVIPEAAHPEEKAEPESPAGEEKAKTEQEEAPVRTGRLWKKSSGVLDYQPETAAAQTDSMWEASTGENVLDPFAPAEEEDKRKPKSGIWTLRRKKKGAEQAEEKDHPAEKESSAVKIKAGWFGRKKKDMVYCPGCGAFVGEEVYCPKCGARVK